MVTGRGEGKTREGGGGGMQEKFYPYRKGGGEKMFSRPEGGVGLYFQSVSPIFRCTHLVRTQFDCYLDPLPLHVICNGNV